MTTSRAFKPRAVGLNFAFSAALSATLLSGCGSLVPSKAETPIAFAKNQPQIVVTADPNRATSFARSGRISVVFQGDLGTEPMADGSSAGGNSTYQNLFVSFEFSGNAQEGTLILTSPLGTQLGVARWGRTDPAQTGLSAQSGLDSPFGSNSKTFATLQQANGQTYTFGSADEMLYALTRLPLQLATLVQWLEFARHKSDLLPATQPASLPEPWHIDASRFAQGRVVASHPGGVAATDQAPNRAGSTALPLAPPTPPFTLTLIVADYD